MESEVCAFNLNNKQAYKILEVVFNGNQVQHNFKAKYLGIFLTTHLLLRSTLRKQRRSYTHVFA